MVVVPPLTSPSYDRFFFLLLFRPKTASYDLYVSTYLDLDKIFYYAPPFSSGVSPSSRQKNASALQQSFQVMIATNSLYSRAKRFRPPHIGIHSPREVAQHVQGFLDLHENSIAIYVWRLHMCGSALNDGCGAQTNPTPDLTLTLTPTLTHPFRGLSVCSRGRQGQY